MPDSVESVEYGAFCDCKHLSSIRLGANLSSIAGWAFCGCSSLENISVSENNTNYYVTGNCLIFTEWKSVVLGCKNSTIPEDDNVNGVSYVAFAGCEALEEITIPQNIEFIGEEAFEDCINLKTVNMEFGLKVIGHGAFRNCTSLNNIVLPESLIALGEYGLSPAGGVFENCVSLKKISIPSGVTNVYNYAFSGCTNLKTVEIGNSVKYIDYGAFSNCTELTSITIPDSVTSVGYEVFSGCAGLTSITMPDSVTLIDFDAFKGCDKLKDVWYTGSEEQRDSISIFSGNDYLLNATWHYNYVPETQVCAHSKTEVRNAKVPTCTKSGYTGDTYCKDCEDKIADGEVIPAKGHKYVWKITKLATESESGLKEEICSVCGEKTGRTQEILYTGHITGDINGDSAVNNKDLTRLFQYLSDWDVEVNEAALDVNGDGSVNNKDLTRLFQYLSDWDVEIF